MSCGPQLGPQLWERKVVPHENEPAALQAQLRSAVDKIADLERERETEKQEREEFETLVLEELQRLQDELKHCQDTKQQDDARIELLQTSLQQHRDSVEQYQESLRQRDDSIVEVTVPLYLTRTFCVVWRGSAWT